MEEVSLQFGLIPKCGAMTWSFVKIGGFLRGGVQGEGVIGEP